MNTFSVKFKVGSIEIDVIVTAFDSNKFKVELITGEPDPIQLERSNEGSWKIRNPGKRKISDREFQKLTKAIDEHLKSITGTNTNS